MARDIDQNLLPFLVSEFKFWTLFVTRVTSSDLKSSPDGVERFCFKHLLCESRVSRFSKGHPRRRRAWFPVSALGLTESDAAFGGASVQINA